MAAAATEVTVRLRVLTGWWASLLDRFRDLFSAGPEKYSIVARQRRPPSTSRLYILHVDHPVQGKHKEALDELAQKLKDEYGIGLIVMEPGMILSRFDDV